MPTDFELSSSTSSVRSRKSSVSADKTVSSPSTTNSSSSSQPTIVDLFCGGGGSSIGFDLAGFRVCKAYDNDDSVLRVYNDNHYDHKATKLDLNDIDAAVASITEVGERGVAAWVPDVIVASPPCTDFSQAGGIVEGEAASLTVKCAEIISRIRPSCFVIENVVRAATSMSFARAVEILSNAGYVMRVARIDACHTGVPQRRKRIFCIGVHMDGPSHARRSVDRACEDIEAAEARGEKTTIAEAFEMHQLTPVPRFLHYVPRNSFCPEFVATDRPYPTLRCVNSMTAPRSALKSTYRPSNPICQPHERPVQGLTIAQMCVISSFPLSYKFFSNAVAQKVMGNSVPPLLAAHVARAILRHIVHSGEHLLGDAPHRTAGDHTMIAGLVNPSPVRDPSAVDETERFIDSRFGDKAARSAMGAVVVSRHGSESGARELTYVMGTSADGDLAARRVISHYLKPGWIVVVRERHVRRTRAQDVYVRIPGEDIMYISKKSLLKNGHLSAEHGD